MNSKTDTMTNALDSYSTPQTTGKSLALPFESSSAEMAGIRVTRAEFSRMLGCSKQAVTDWVKSGRVVVGADGRFDPRQAVASLMRTGDPARIRAKVLEPLVRDIAGRDREIVRLREIVAKQQAELEEANEDGEFNEQCVNEYHQTFERLQERLAAEYLELSEIGVEAALNAISRWLDASLERGASLAGLLLDHHRPGELESLDGVDHGDIAALLEEGEGEGETAAIGNTFQTGKLE